MQPPPPSSSHHCPVWSPVPWVAPCGEHSRGPALFWPQGCEQGWTWASLCTLAEGCRRPTHVPCPGRGAEK